MICVFVSKEMKLKVLGWEYKMEDEEEIKITEKEDEEKLIVLIVLIVLFVIDDVALQSRLFALLYFDVVLAWHLQARAIRWIEKELRDRNG